MGSLAASAALGAALRAAEAAGCGLKMADLERIFCAPAPGVVEPDPSLRQAYDHLEASLAKALAV